MTTDTNQNTNDLALKDSKIIELESEIDSLRKELSKREKTASEKKAFRELFPDVEFDSIPDEVHENAKETSSLLASYALYHCRCEIERRKAEIAKKENEMRTPGASLHDGAHSGVYSIDEIARMSGQEVKRNYNQIIKSLIKKIK